MLKQQILLELERSLYLTFLYYNAVKFYLCISQLVRKLMSECRVSHDTTVPRSWSYGYGMDSGSLVVVTQSL